MRGISPAEADRLAETCGACGGGLSDRRKRIDGGRRGGAAGARDDPLTVLVDTSTSPYRWTVPAGILGDPLVEGTVARRGGAWFACCDRREVEAGDPGAAIPVRRSGRRSARPIRCAFNRRGWLAFRTVRGTPGVLFGSGPAIELEELRVEEPLLVTSRFAQIVDQFVRPVVSSGSPLADDLHTPLPPFRALFGVLDSSTLLRTATGINLPTSPRRSLTFVVCRLIRSPARPRPRRVPCRRRAPRSSAPASLHRQQPSRRRDASGPAPAR